ncbi:para-nitrobenzyl esterase-like [Diabrotica undecimpunctata]|uniref:para-nitrobenzyl esterase-like n=1 Tax=Diabrotica undecimpunctata TaxID=50387 RepID=UPI003B63E6C1
MYLKLAIFCWLLYSFTKKGVNSLPGAEAEFEEDELIVELENLGKIRGHILQSAEGKDFYAFQDIPYAEPPIGKNRFKPPKPHGPWEGILNTTSNNKVCPQQFLEKKHKLSDLNEDEDCLVLNVYTPVKPSSNKSLPIFFWIHGGSYVYGAGSMLLYNPKLLVDYDIIVVTINYRLGALGFLTTLDENIPANLALKDQLLALKWTHQNIHKFGGDPKKITVGGESAGSISAGFHLLSRSAKGLINGIIQQSGSPLCGVFYPTNDRKLAFEFGKTLNSSFTSATSSDLLELLQQASTSDILAVQSKLTSGRSVGFMDAITYKPVIEGTFNDDAFITEPMHGAVQDGHFNLVPILIGITSEESLMFLFEINESDIEKRAKFLDEDPKNLIGDYLNVAEQDRAAAGSILHTYYNYSTFTEDRTALIKYTSDEVFTRSVIRQAECASRYVPVYMYELSWLPEGSTDIGVPHSADLWYLWDTMAFGENKETLRKPILKWWTNFIKYQNPTPVLDEELQNVIWPEVQPNAVKYLDINSQFTVKENPRNYYNLKSLLDSFIKPPYVSY